MNLVVLAAQASPRARSIVHSHQDSFGHQLEVFSRGAVASEEFEVACECGWRGQLPTADLDPAPGGRPRRGSGPV